MGQTHSRHCVANHDVDCFHLSSKLMDSVEIKCDAMREELEALRSQHEETQRSLRYRFLTTMDSRTSIPTFRYLHPYRTRRSISDQGAKDRSQHRQERESLSELHKKELLARQEREKTIMELEKAAETHETLNKVAQDELAPLRDSKQELAEKTKELDRLRRELDQAQMQAASMKQSLEQQVSLVTAKFEQGADDLHHERQEAQRVAEELFQVQTLTRSNMVPAEKQQNLSVLLKAAAAVVVFLLAIIGWMVFYLRAFLSEAPDSTCPSTGIENPDISANELARSGASATASIAQGAIAALKKVKLPGRGGDA